jgi:hypothetical protein
MTSLQNYSTWDSGDFFLSQKNGETSEALTEVSP